MKLLLLIKDMKKENILNILRTEEVRKMFLDKHIFSLSLFWSFARWDNTKDSDIDLIVKYDNSWNTTIFDILELKEKLQKKLNYKNIDLIVPRAKDKRFLSVIKDDLIKIY